jgi:hypothetical protein
MNSRATPSLLSTGKEETLRSSLLSTWKEETRKEETVPPLSLYNKRTGKGKEQGMEPAEGQYPPPFQLRF